jgi:hypothetical protein
MRQRHNTASPARGGWLDRPKDSGILRTAVLHDGVNVGVYAEVVQGGTIHRGDPVRFAKHPCRASGENEFPGRLWSNPVDSSHSGWSLRSYDPTKLEWRRSSDQGRLEQLFFSWLTNATALAPDEVERADGLLHRLNSDASLTRLLLHRQFAKRPLTMSADEGHGFWAITVPGGRGGLLGLERKVDLPSLELLRCYQAIAQHLLDTPLEM